MFIIVLVLQKQIGRIVLITIQIPRPAFDDDLSACIAAGDCLRTRELFDQAFWNGYKVSLTWTHLKTALRAENKPMLKLLITWGAAVTDEDLRQFRAVAKNKYPDYIKLLRQCGLKLSAAAQEDIPYVAPQDPSPNADLLPDEWKLVLRMMQAKGAEEAVIAGGALRDLFNERPVKDVDIFLKGRGSERKNRAFLTEVFKATRLGIDAQSDYSSSYFGTYESFPAPKKNDLSIRFENKEGYDTIIKEGRSESWTVIAGPQKTEYNIVFIDNLKYTSPKSGHYVPADFDKGHLINGFDLGLCQIAYDGQEISKTWFYEIAVKYQEISLFNPNDKSKEHLQRIIKKYPDWKLCAKSKQLLAPKPGFWLRGRGTNTGPR
jgi:hypothetical protein